MRSYDLQKEFANKDNLGTGIIFKDGLFQLESGSRYQVNAGENISIEENVISALGYKYDKEKNSFSVGVNGATASGMGSYAEGANTKAEGVCSHSEGFSTTSSNNYSHAEGGFTVASGPASHAEGSYSKASGEASHAEGVYTITSGYASHAEGGFTNAFGEYSHAEGYADNKQLTGYNWEINSQSITFDSEQSLGDEPILKIENNGENLFVKVTAISEDKLTITVDKAISLECDENSSLSWVRGIAYGDNSHTEGYGAIASGKNSHAEGRGTQTYNEAEHAEGKYNVSNTTDWIGDTIHSVGIGTSDEDRKNALEVTTQGAVYMKDVGGYDGTTLAECYPVLLVINALLDSKNNDIPAINKRIDNLNIPTLPENIVNTVNGKTGDVTIDTSEFATKEEVQAVNTRIDELNIPSDLSNVVTKTDNYQVTLGTDNNATHEKTLLVGTGLATSNNEALVVGAYNNSEYFVNCGVDAPAIQVGAGTEDSKRTVMVVQKNGKSSGLLGFEQNGFGDFAEYFEWADGNPEGEDRVGYMVLLNKDKIELAESLDNCIGIITGTGAFVADSACLDWHGRYLKDKWGRNIYALTGVLAENPEYDPTKEYIPREYRKEWSPVGLVGKILVRQDGTLKPNGFVGCVNGIATNVDKSSWRVLKVIDEEIALVLIK